jgi:hypothetical protein
MKKLLVMSKSNIRVSCADYKRVEDVKGQSETLVKKSMIAQFRGDAELVANYTAERIAVERQSAAEIDV